MRSEASSILPDDPRRVRWLSMRSGGAPGAGSWMLRAAGKRAPCGRLLPTWVCQATPGTFGALDAGERAPCGRGCVRLVRVPAVDALRSFQHSPG